MGLGYLMELATGHYKSKVLFVATNLGIFDLLSKGPKTLQNIAKEVNIQTRPATMLLNACVALNLLEKEDIVYSNSRTADLYLVDGKPQYIKPAFFKFDEHSYLLFDKLEEAILKDAPQISPENPDDPELSPSCMLIGNKEDYANFISALDPIAIWPARAIAGTFDFSQFKRLIDVGGGSGVYSIAIVEKNPNIEAIVFDLPHVCEIAQNNIAKKKLSERIKCHPGDYFKHTLPEGFDVALLSNVLHGYGPDMCELLLQKIYDSLPSGGAIIVSDTVLDDNGYGPETAVLMSLYYLLITEQGRNYTVSEYEYMLKNAGFIEIKPYKTSAATTYIAGRKR